MPPNTHDELREMLEVCVYVCIVDSLHAFVQQSAVFCIHLVFLRDEFVRDKHEIHVMLKLFSNISNILEQIHILKTSVVAQVTVQANMNTNRHFSSPLCTQK